MIQEEFKDLVFKFARHASVNEVAYIFLFGSVAKGDTDRRSDIDILVILDTYDKDFEDMEAKTRISELALTLEKEYDRGIQVVFTNKKYEGLDEHFIEEVLKEGIILYAKSPSIEIRGLTLEPYAMIMFSLENLNSRDKMKIKRILYGQKTRKVIKDKTYESIKIGIVQSLKGMRIGPGAVLLPQKKASILENEMKKLKLTLKRVDILLTENSLRRMRA
jgi:predicted nucleotidyltransferase